MPRAPQSPCLCTQCHEKTFLDAAGCSQRGVLLDAKTRRKHELSDRRQAAAVVEVDDTAVNSDRRVPPSSAAEGSSNPPLLGIDHTHEESHQDIESLQAAFKALSITQHSLHTKSKLISGSHQLKFAAAPASVHEAQVPFDERHEATARYLQILKWLKSAKQQLEEPTVFNNKDFARRREVLCKDVAEEIRRLEAMGELAWSRSKVDQLFGGPGLKPNDVPIVKAKNRFASNMDPLLLSSLLLVIIMHALAASSQSHMRFFLATLRVIIYGAFVFNRGSTPSTLTPEQVSLLTNIPQDVRTIIQKLEVEPDCTLYACCGDCFALYPPDSRRPRSPYPQTCTHKEFGRKPCGGRLTSEAIADAGDKQVLHALKVFPYHNLFSWLRDLFMRPGLEEAMASAWTRTSRNGQWNDIFDTPDVQNFRGPDRTTFFSIQPNHSVHLLFSLFVDWFNPFGNKAGGKSHSIGAIYMACLNLPADIRYRAENIYLVGIIPGPKEPSLQQINHFLKPLVDDLLVLWLTGIYLAQTASRSAGRLVRAAIILLVCDLPAMRKVAGYAGHAHKGYFCSFCKLPRSNINNANPDTWPKGWSWSEHLEAANAWRTATTKHAQDQIFDRFGIRWSELLRLDYWDPTRFTVVDAMHNLFLGVIRHHCMEVWGITVKGGDTRVLPHTPEQQQQALNKIAKAVKKGSVNMLKAVRKGYVVAVVKLNNITPAGTSFRKIDYINGLLAWSAENDTDSLRLPNVLLEPTTEFHLPGDEPDISQTSILDKDILNNIRHDIQTIFVPSWVERPPPNFGSGSHGKLKADTWRTLFTIHLTITLVRLWGSQSATPREQSLLENFVYLAIAADQASRRSMSVSRAEKYSQNILGYLSSLRKTFDHPFVPNHHLSYHLKQGLLRFGPVHTWWAYPFERYNGIIARQNSNNKSGHMSLTFLRYFYIGATLRWVMSTIRWPEHSLYDEMVTAFRSTFGDVMKGTWTANALSVAKETDHISWSLDPQQAHSLPEDIYAALLNLVNTMSSTIRFSHIDDSSPTDPSPSLPKMGQFVRTIKHKNLIYATLGRGTQNSFIIFKTTTGVGNAPKAYAGQVNKILLHLRRVENGEVKTEPFLVVRSYKALSPAHSAHDPWKVYPDLDAKLYYNKYSQIPHLIPFENVISHAAAYVFTPEDIGKECIVIKGLDRA